MEYVLGDEETIEDLKETIPELYAITDSLIGVVTRDAAEEDIVMVISDHGHDRDGSGHRFGAEGIIVMAEGPVQQGGKIESATVFDVLPTVFHTMGVPVPVGIKGRVLTDIFKSD